MVRDIKNENRLINVKKINFNIFKNIQPFSLKKKKKIIFFQKEMNFLTNYHYKHSKDYKILLKKFGYKNENQSLENIPFLPTRLFKELDLISINQNKIFKVLRSSGTYGSIPSKIYLDQKNAHNQIIVLSKIISSFLGEKRVPMLIIDQDPILNDKKMFGARSAAIFGFSIFGTHHTYLLNREGEIDYDKLNNFIKNFGDKPFFIFGFTSLIFEFLIKKLYKKKLKNVHWSNAIMLHGGGWKKMEQNKINNKKFKSILTEKLNIRKIYNYYGLVEQTGSIFIECQKCFCFITSVFSDIIIRDKYFNVLEEGKKGFIQLMSLLPSSYPGHNILTEDLGQIVNNDKCICADKGKAFLVFGRMPNAEIRGCSDTV